MHRLTLIHLIHMFKTKRHLNLLNQSSIVKKAHNTNASSPTQEPTGSDGHVAKTFQLLIVIWVITNIGISICNDTDQKKTHTPVEYGYLYYE